MRMTEAIEYLFHILKELGAHNLLAVGIAIIIAWLLISGFRKGLKRENRDKGSKDDGHGE